MSRETHAYLRLHVDVRQLEHLLTLAAHASTQVS